MFFFRDLDPKDKNYFTICSFGIRDKLSSFLYPLHSYIPYLFIDTNQFNPNSKDVTNNIFFAAAIFVRAYYLEV